MLALMLDVPFASALDCRRKCNSRKGHVSENNSDQPHVSSVPQVAGVDIDEWGGVRLGSGGS